jgi:anthraniloyl-CoA monooxygenase
MNIVCIGGGPAGLYFGLLMKERHPDHRVTVFERRHAGESSGWGVVLSDQTRERLAVADAASALAIGQAFKHWDDIEIRFKGQTIRSGGHGFCGIARGRLLDILRGRCEELGVRLRYGSEVDDDAAVADACGADLVIACDGLNSRIRARYAATYLPQVEQRRCRYVWLGTTRPFAAFTFDFRQTPHGWFQAHAYQYQGGYDSEADGAISTVIVETPEAVWRAAGLDRMSAEEGIAFCERLFADLLDGHALRANAPAGTVDGAALWSTFPRIVNGQWVHWNGAVPVVLMGDAAHSAHFSIGSGTKLALEDAIELADCLGAVDSPAGLGAALQTYQQNRSVEAARLQSAARNSMEWFENVERYGAMEAPQFAYSMLTRSQRLSHENLRLRDPGYVAGYEAWWSARACARAGLDAPAELPAPPPMLTPWRVRGLTLKNRIVVAPMAQYSAVDGVAGDYHLMHLGARAMGGAALVLTEMTGVSADARITPGCPGMYAPAHAVAWQTIVGFIHANSDTKVGLQLGHAGPKGSTRVMWEGMDQPLAEGNWPLLAASEQQYLAGVSQVARAADAADMARIEADFVAATRAAALAGFDWLELHCAHGYLMSSFISPLTNRRDDEYGGSLVNRCRFPLRVFAAMRAAWPIDRPMSVRISAHDWVDGGTTPDDAVAIARLFKAAGADVIDCSSGQVSKAERPVYGRMFQTPFADRVRNEADIASIAVGAIADGDQVNGIIAAGRADLCAVGRPHLANPAWTLTQAARFGWQAMAWPRQYRPARSQLERSFTLSGSQYSV